MSSPPPVDFDDQPLPRNLGKYTLLRVLGSGATSTVYLADDPFNGRQVAVKVVKQVAAADKHAEGDLAGLGLRTEAALLGKLNHPHIVKIFDVVPDGADHYVVMECVEGGTMEKHCRRGTLLHHEAVVDTIFKCGKALEYMNVLGLIHRDIKPANILITTNNDIRLSDLGATLISTRAGQTESGIGTPLYMSPEQLLGRDLDFRSDMFSLGVVFYQLLTGETPFEGDNIQQLMVQTFEANPTPPSEVRPSVPPAIDIVIARMMGKMPSERYASWRECLAALLEIEPALRAQNKQSIDLASESERFSLLRGSPFFRLFSDEDLWYVLEIGEFKPFEQGDVLIREGDIGECFFVMLSGQAKVTKQDQLIDLVTNGMSMGEISYVLEGRGPRNTTCTAILDGIALRIEDAALRGASEICRARFEKTFLQTMASWLVDADKRLSTMP